MMTARPSFPGAPKARPKGPKGRLSLALAALLAGAASGRAQGTFSNYVAVGDGLTAGFSSGSLVQSHQANSFPALIAHQAGAPGFEQPLVSAPGIPAQLRLVSLSPLIIAPQSGSGSPTNLNLARPYNNLAVPGSRVADVVNTVTDNGGLHDLILRRQGTALQQAVFLRPTFVTVWIGNNDALAAATSGRVIEDVTLTSVHSFELNYRVIANTLAATGAKLAFATIPDVTSIPFVTTIASFITVPTTGQQVPLIGPNGLLTANDRVLLTAQAELAVGKGIPTALGGTGQPLSDASVLSAGEIATISARVAAFNNVIRAVASEKNAALVDINAQFSDVAQHGLPIGGLTFTSNFLTGGLFSYDGVHPTAIGYAYVANLFIDAINDKYNGEIPLVNLYPFIFGTASASSGLTAADSFMDDPSTALLTPEAIRNLFWALKVEIKPTKRPGHRKH
jgi:lysophospholipase L1-like esterase